MTADSRTVRETTRIVTAHRQREGAGFVVRRPFPTQGLDLADPFLLLDEMGPVDYGPGEAVGAPDHPHRGFETITYMLEGEFEHEDSAGHRGVLRGGDVQWMTAGAVPVHSGMPSGGIREKGGGLVGNDGAEARDGQMELLGPGDAVRLGGAAGGGRLLLLAGVPIHEPVARYGPFVMNTQAELVEAVRDYQSGRMGEITRTAEVL